MPDSLTFANTVAAALVTLTLSLGCTRPESLPGDLEPRFKAAAAGVFACCRYRESRVRPEVTELSGRRAFQFGTYRDVIQPIGQEPITFYGRFSAILDRSGANSWYVTRLMVVRDSSVPPLPAKYMVRGNR